MVFDRRKEIREGLREFRCVRCTAVGRCDWHDCDAALAGFIAFLADSGVVMVTEFPVGKIGDIAPTPVTLRPTAPLVEPATERPVIQDEAAYRRFLVDSGGGRKA
jgi:hypothetical protein